MPFTKFASLGVVFILALVSTPISAWARDRPRMQIVFQLDEPLWLGKIVDDEHAVTDLNEEVAANLVHTFGSRIGFIDFVTEPAPQQLKISLLRHPVDPGTDFIPTDFKLEVLGLPPDEGQPTLLLPFRSGVEYVESITYQGLIDEARRRMETRLTTGTYLADIVRDLLSHVSISSEVHVIRLGNMSVAVIPWSRDEIRMAASSEFTIKTPIPGLNLPRDHYTRVIGQVTDQMRNRLSAPYTRGLVVIDRALPDGTALAEIEIPDPNLPVPIIGLHVTLYIHAAVIDQPHSPSGFNDE